MRWVAALALLSGCDVVLGLKEQFDAMPDAPLPDAANGCWSVLYQDNDEDGDEHLDGCDNCPAVSNTVQDDSDDDGVGDACDRSDSSREQIAYFRSFSASSHIDGTMAAGGHWTVGGGSLVQDNASVEATLFLPGTFVGARVLVEVRGVSSPTGTKPNREAGVAISLDNARTMGLVCVGRRRFGDTAAVALSRIGMLSNSGLPATLGTSLRLEISAAAMNGMPSCEANSVPPAKLELTGVGPTEGKIGVVTSQSTVEVLSITVITPR